MTVFQSCSDSFSFNCCFVRLRNFQTFFSIIFSSIFFCLFWGPRRWRTTLGGAPGTHCTCQIWTLWPIPSPLSDLLLIRDCRRLSKGFQPAIARVTEVCMYQLSAFRGNDKNVARWRYCLKQMFLGMQK